MLLRIVSCILLTACLPQAAAGPALAQTEKKVLYGVRLDNTGSMESELDRVKALGRGVVNHIHRHGPVSIFSFKKDVKGFPRAAVTPGVEWSPDHSLLDRYVKGLSIKSGRTTLYDAIHSMAGQINAKAGEEKGPAPRKVIILITDGEDRGSRVSEEQLVKELRESNIQVYAIGLVEELRTAGGLMGQFDHGRVVRFLKKITTETGGRAVISRLRTEELDQLLRELIAGSD